MASLRANPLHQHNGRTLEVGGSVDVCPYLHVSSFALELTEKLEYHPHFCSSKQLTYSSLASTRAVRASSPLYTPTHCIPAFIHKATLISKIRDARDTLEPVIILALCALAVRFVPALEEFCMANRLPLTYYSDTSRNLVFASVDEPSIESCQAAYCLGIADWSSGNGTRSWLMTGIAIRSRPPLIKGNFLC
jgi:hypothetical protein